MQKRLTMKNPQQEIQLVTRHCILALVIMLILMLLLIMRLGFLQLVKQNLYTTLSNKNWLDLLPIEPKRGLIYDRNGILLAENVPVFSLDVIPDKIKNMHMMLSDIAKIIPLTDTELMQFQKSLKQHRRFDEIPLKLRLTEQEAALFYENQYRFPGVFIKTRLIRHYPFGESLSHVLGYMGRINLEELNEINEIDASNYSASNYIGKLGIEKFYEDDLHGTVGYAQAENDASGQSIRILKQIKPIPGKDLYLTIDVRLQLIAQQALAGYSGAVVAIQPATGQILAMVSEPAFDPNNFVTGISTENFHALQSAPNRPLYHRAIRGLYPLASTIKPYIALAGLETGNTTPDFSINDPGWYELPHSTHRFHDWKPHGHGIVDLHHAIVSSCDTYFFGLAHKMGIRSIDGILSKFGFGELTGVDSEEEISGMIASPAWKRRVKKLPWYEGDTIISAIGQGYMQATPLQLAQGIAILANRGRKISPHLLLTEKIAQSQIIPLKDSTWDAIIQAMQDVITSPLGTGYTHFGHDAAYTIAAKTGTAQVYSIKYRNAEGASESQDNLPEQLRDHSLFIAFAPVDKPEIAIAVVVEHSKLAASVARKVLDSYFKNKEESGNKPGSVVDNHLSGMPVTEHLKQPTRA